MALRAITKNEKSKNTLLSSQSREKTSIRIKIKKKIRRVNCTCFRNSLRDH
jgi:hypothetical protein